MLYDDRYSELSAAMKSAFENTLKLSSVDLSGLSETFQQLSRLQTLKPDLNPLIETIQRISLAEHPSYRNTILHMQQFSQSLKDSLPVSDELQQSIIGVLRSAQSYMDDDQKSAVNEIDPCILNPSPDQPITKPKFSIPILLTVLSMLMNLIFFLIQQMPDDQLEEIAAQDKQIIALDDKNTQMHSEEIALLIQLNETGQKIVDLLNDDAEIGPLFANESESFLDGLADLDQIPVDSPESDSDSGSQQDAGDADQ